MAPFEEITLTGTISLNDSIPYLNGSSQGNLRLIGIFDWLLWNNKRVKIKGYLRNVGFGVTEIELL